MHINSISIIVITAGQLYYGCMFISLLSRRSYSYNKKEDCKWRKWRIYSRALLTTERDREFFLPAGSVIGSGQAIRSTTAVLSTCVTCNSVSFAVEHLDTPVHVHKSHKICHVFVLKMLCHSGTFGHWHPLNTKKVLSAKFICAIMPLIAWGTADITASHPVVRCCWSPVQVKRVSLPNGSWGCKP